MKYLVAVLFIFLFIWICIELGSFFSSKLKIEKKYSFILGFISLFVYMSIPGVILQFLNTSWIIYFWVQTIFLAFLLIALFFCSGRPEWNPRKIRAFFNEYYFSLLLALILVVCVLLSFAGLWLGNHQDDGFYLLRIGLLPTLDHIFTDNVANGFNIIANNPIDISHSFDVKVINTAELEWAYWNVFLKLDPSFYSRAVISFINYFFVIEVIKVFIIEVNSYFGIQLSKKQLLTFLSFVLLFAANYRVFAYLRINALQDGFFFQTAMYFGSTVIRTTGLFLLLILHFVNWNKIQRLSYWVLVCWFMMTRSTTALPIIVMSTIVFFIFNYPRFIENKKSRLMILMIVILINGGLWLTGSVNELATLTFPSVLNVLMKLLPIISLSIIVWSCFKANNLRIKSFSRLLVYFFVISFVPYASFGSLKVSVFSFVLMRWLSTFLYFLYAYSVVVLFSENKSIRNFFTKNIAFTLFNTFVVLATIMIGGGSILPPQARPEMIGPRRLVKTILQNTDFTPRHTKLVAKYIQNYSENNNLTLNMMMDHFTYTDGVIETVDSMIRLYMPSVRVVSAIPRYSYVQPKYASFTEETYNQVMNSLSSDTDTFTQLVRRYSINSFLLRTDERTKFLENNGFRLIRHWTFDNTAPFYLYVKS